MREPSAASAAARASSVPEEEDVEEQGHSYSRRTLICRGSNYALPQTALPHRKLPSAPVAEPIELDGFELPWAVRLLHEVYGSVMSARSGHIDWVAVARRMEAQRKPLVAAAAALSRSNKAAAASAAAAAAAAAEHPGAVSTVPPLESATSLEPATLPPPFTPQSVHRLWRFLAYRSGLNGLALPETAAADVESAGVKGALKNGPSSDADRAASGPLDVAERPEQAERKRSRADLDDPNQDPNEDPNEDPNGGPDPDEARDTKRARLDVQGGRIEAIKAEEGQIDRGHAEPVAMDGFVEMNGPTPPPLPTHAVPPPPNPLVASAAPATDSTASGLEVPNPPGGDVSRGASGASAHSVAIADCAARGVKGEAEGGEQLPTGGEPMAAMDEAAEEGEEGEECGLFFGEPPLYSLRGSATAAWMRHGDVLRPGAPLLTRFSPASSVAASVRAPCDSIAVGECTAAPAEGDESESDVDEFLQAHHRRVLELQAEPKKSDGSTKRPPLWPAHGTPRLVGRKYPAWPGVSRKPKLPEDGSGPLNLGVPPPGKKGSAAGGSAEGKEKSYSLKEAMQLKVTLKPWNDEEDRKLVAAVEKHGAGAQNELCKAMKRTWGSLNKRILDLQRSGKIRPKGDTAGAKTGDKVAASEESGAAAAEQPGGGGAKGGGAKGGGAKGGGAKGGGGKAAGAKKEAAAGDGKADKKPRVKMTKEEKEREKERVKEEKKRFKEQLKEEKRLAKENAAAGIPSKEMAAGFSELTAPVATVDPASNPKLDKRTAKALRGFIEIFWDGEGQWFEAEVLGYNEATKDHTVKYSADLMICEERLHGGTTPWRHVLKTTARGAAAKARSGAAAKASLL